MSALRFGADRSWRSQEHSADGGTACGWDYDQLHHFIAAGVWDAKPVETELLVQADKLVGGSDAVLVIDDTAIAKKGTHSEGVAPQYASALGKTANCQTLVSLTLARGEVPVMLALRLFLPESWTSNPARLQHGCSGRGTDEAGDSAGDFLGSARWGLRLRKSIYFGAMP